jgi:hypothetical protein
MAMLDAILMPDWYLRYYSYDAHWDSGEEMASMRDGSGNAYFGWFTEQGAAFKGFEKSSPLASYVTDNEHPFPGLYDGLPEELGEFLSEPAFDILKTTFCFWYLNSEESWKTGRVEWDSIPSDAARVSIVQPLAEGASVYRSWAEGYYEQKIPLSSVKKVFELKPLDEELVNSLNSERSFSELEEDIRAIGYPS